MNKKRYTVENFKKDILKVIELCENDLEKIETNQKTEATKEQIEAYIIPEMNDLLNKIKNDMLPPKDRRWILSTAYITRGWNWDINAKDELKDILGYLDNRYRYDLE